MIIIVRVKDYQAIFGICKNTASLWHAQDCKQLGRDRVTADDLVRLYGVDERRLSQIFPNYTSLAQ